MPEPKLIKSFFRLYSSTKKTYKFYHPGFVLCFRESILQNLWQGFKQSGTNVLAVIFCHQVIGEIFLVKKFCQRTFDFVERGATTASNFLHSLFAFRFFLWKIEVIPWSRGIVLTSSGGNRKLTIAPCHNKKNTEFLSICIEVSLWAEK